MNIAERIFQTVKTLPESEALEVLHFVEILQASHDTESSARRAKALATLAKYRGRYKAEKLDRESLYDRPLLR